MSSKSKDTDDSLDRDLVLLNRITVDMLRVHVHREKYQFKCCNCLGYRALKEKYPEKAKTFFEYIVSKEQILQRLEDSLNAKGFRCDLCHDNGPDSGLTFFVFTLVEIETLRKQIYREKYQYNCSNCDGYKALAEFYPEKAAAFYDYLSHKEGIINYLEDILSSKGFRCDSLYDKGKQS